MNNQPTYKKFEADSPQFQSVGRAMHEHWFHPTASGRYRHEFCHDDICYLLEWMWHNERYLEGVISDKEREIENLKTELMKLNRQ